MALVPVQYNDTHHLGHCPGHPPKVGTRPPQLGQNLPLARARQSTSTLAVCPKRNPPKNARTADRYVAFITNIRVDNPRDLLRRIPKTYRKRWGIETGYRILKQARARTKSPRMVARLFLMFFSLAYVNFWLLYRRALIGNGGPHAKLPMADYSDILWMHVTTGGRPP